MRPFNIKLSEDHRQKLEAYRSMRGLRSEADAVRDLIDRSDMIADVARQVDLNEQTTRAPAKPKKPTTPGKRFVGVNAATGEEIWT